jgi:5-methyltetrahydrofolate--homocysteine methyltransferase
MTDFNAIQDALVSCDGDRVVTLVNEEIKTGTPAEDILKKGLIVGMDLVGEKMENGDMFIPEVLMAAQAMGRCVAI